MWNEWQTTQRNQPKSIVFIIALILFKFMCLIPVSCDVIVHANTDAAVCDLNRVTRCPDRPGFISCDSVSQQIKNKNKKYEHVPAVRFTDVKYCSLPSMSFYSYCLWCLFWHCRERKQAVCLISWYFNSRTYFFQFSLV